MIKHAGFTLVELLVTVAVAGILLALVAPAFHHAYLSGQRAARTNEFVETLAFARSQALALRRPVVICSSIDATASVPVCGAAQGWEDGWLVFIDRSRTGPGTTNQLDALDADANRDGALTAADGDLNGDGLASAADAILRRHEGLLADSERRLSTDRRFSLRGNANVANRIVFDGTGISTSNGTLVACDVRGFGAARVIVVSTGGRVQSMDSDDKRVPQGTRTCLR